MKKPTKEDHSPLDSAIFAVLNSSLFGLLFSISMFHKSYESSQFSFRQKVNFTGRNMLVISTMHGLNQFLTKYFKTRKFRESIKNKFNLTNKMSINFLSTLLATGIPTMMAYKIYFFKNEYILIDKKFFLGVGLIFFLFDLYDFESKTKTKY